VQVVAPALTYEFEAHKTIVAIDRRPQRLRIEASKPEAWLDTAVGVNQAAEVVRGGAALQRGRELVTRLRRGRKLYITEIRDNWAATTILANGKPQSGWVKVADLKPLPTEPRAFRHLENAAGGSFVSAAMLAQKAKQFDDGLYAAAEVAAQQGHGSLPSKTDLIRDWSAKVEANAADPGFTILLAAGQLGGAKNAIPRSQQQAVANALSQFESVPERSKPLGFYTWSKELSAIFRQDRMLQTPLPSAAGVAAIVSALKEDPALAEAYARHLSLAAKLTNPLVSGDSSDLRPLLADQRPDDLERIQKWRVLPPSLSHESQLFLRLFGNETSVPDDFDLMAKLIAEIRGGGIDLTPRPESGWYDHQTWALQPLLVPQKMDEASHLTCGEEYAKHLEELFKGTLALTRETHVKQLDFPAPAAAAFEEPQPKLELYVQPNLSIEPLATHYLRRAQSYAFVRQVLREAFGEDSLASLHRQTAERPLDMPLAEELDQMVALFYGAHVVASRQLGLPEAAGAAVGIEDADAAAVHLLRWAALRGDDADLGRDSRMMVPVFVDPMNQRIKVWCVLGWTTRDAWASFEQHPKLTATDAAGEAVDLASKFDVHFTGQSLTLASPVFAEVWVKRLLNRDEFRRHCDTYVTPAVILGNLE
jgi:hypothetical protein